MMKHEKSKKHLKKSFLFTVLQAVCLIIFLYAAFRLCMIFWDYEIAANEYEMLGEYVTALPIPDASLKETENLQGTEEGQIMQSYEIDLNVLKNKNEDLVGWIILPDTKINYPIVKSKDNEEYLNKTFEGQESSSGAIFMDMYCENDFSSDNTIIYGHNMKNGSMFRTLNHMTEEAYFDEHQIFYIHTGNAFEKYAVISCYETVDTDLSSWRIFFDSKEDYGKWLENITKRCSYQCQKYDITKRTITLSTCRGKSGGSGRYVVHLQKMDENM